MKEIKKDNFNQLSMNNHKTALKYDMEISDLEQDYKNLDIIKQVKDNFNIPVMAYQVSGEYSLFANGINKGLIDEDVIIESLISFKRAGANAIVSYYADRLDKILK